MSVAILDTGIRWQEQELADKVRLNRGELPLPQHANATDCANYNCNGDDAFNVADYADDPRVSESAGDDTSDTGSNADAILDASDLIATFSQGTDSDSNGYVDDIAGWDFFDDDNDPYDASSCCSADGHGTGRALEALAKTNNGAGDTGLCPKCQLVPLRIWDSFVPPTDNWALAVTYAVDNGANVAEGAIGGLTNTRFARSAVRYADSKGMALMLVSSDINSANHNYPTNYDEAVYVAGAFPDTAPNGTCTGPGGLPGFDALPGPPEEFEQEFEEGCQQFLAGLAGDRRHPQRAALHDELLPQLQPDPVRGQGRHRPDGLDRLREHRPGGGGRRAPGVVRAGRLRRHPVPGRAARQRDPPAPDDDRRGRPAGQHRGRSASPTRPTRAGTRTSATAGSTWPRRWPGST